MPLSVNYKITYGEYTEIQDKPDGTKGTYRIKIHWANALCAFIHHYTNDKGEKIAQLVNFYADEKHLKNVIKSWGDPLTLGDHYTKVKNVKLNIYYKEAQTLLKALTKCGYKVTTYYKEPETR